MSLTNQKGVSYIESRKVMTHIFGISTYTHLYQEVTPLIDIKLREDIQDFTYKRYKMWYECLFFVYILSKKFSSELYVNQEYFNKYYKLLARSKISVISNIKVDNSRIKVDSSNIKIDNFKIKVEITRLKLEILRFKLVIPRFKQT